MDEMEAYRERIDRRYSGRRLKTDRRRTFRKEPKIFEKEALWLLAALLAIATFLGLTK